MRAMTQQSDHEWSTSEEAQLLAQFAPILRFDGRELFFPVAVDEFIAASTLVREETEVLPVGRVTEEALEQHSSPGCCM